MVYGLCHQPRFDRGPSNQKTKGPRLRLPPETSHRSVCWLGFIAAEASGRWVCFCGDRLFGFDDRRLTDDSRLVSFLSFCWVLGTATAGRFRDFDGVAGFDGAAGGLAFESGLFGLPLLKFQIGSSSTTAPHLHLACWPISDSSMSTKLRLQFEQVTENANAVSFERKFLTIWFLDYNRSIRPSQIKRASGMSVH